MDKTRYTLSIGAVNCHGMKEKIEYPELYNLIKNHDIFGVCETWLNKKEALEIDVDGYKFYHIARKTKTEFSRGGIGYFVKNEIRKHVKFLENISNENFIWCKIDKNHTSYNEDLYICMSYIPPKDSTKEKKINVDHFGCLKEITTKINSDHIIIMGDLNSRTKTICDIMPTEKHDESTAQNFYSKIKSTRNNQDNTSNAYGKKLIDYCIASNSYIANGRTLGDLEGKLTCHQKLGSSTVDYIILNECLYNHVDMMKVLDPTIGSDHCPIRLKLSYRRTQTVNKNHNFTKLQNKIRWDDRMKNNFKIWQSSDEFTEIICEIEQHMNIDDDIETTIEKIKKLFLRFDVKPGKHIKKKKVQKQTWYDDTCQRLAAQLRYTSKLLTKSPTNPYIKGNWFKIKKEYKKTIRIRKREWIKGMIQQMESIESKDPKEYWKLVNEIRKKKRSDTHFDPTKFVTYFEKLYAAPVDPKRDIATYVEKQLQNVDKCNQFQNKVPDFTIDELKLAIKALKNNKAAGLDRIPADMIKASSDKLLHIILKCMNKIKNVYKSPRSWSKGITSLLHKEGDYDEPENYRGITVTEALSKIYSILLLNRLQEWEKTNNIEVIEQIGFKKKCRPADHVFVLKSIMTYYVKRGKKLYSCFVDFRKAFDMVWRTGLFYKLLTFGLDPIYVKLIKTLYDNSCQTLKSEEGITRFFNTSRGVRQGCILSPFLFKMFLNDLPKIFDQNCNPVSVGQLKISCLMYADDLVVFSETKEGLQRCLHQLKRYTEEWGLSINLKKTKIMLFQNGGKKINHNFYFGIQKMDLVNNYKYLGTTISNSGSFKNNDTLMKKKASRASFLITKNITKNASVKTSIKLFEKLIEPILLYNCEITKAYFPTKWTVQDFKNKMWDLGGELEKVSTSFIRQLLCIHKKSTNLATMGEVGKFPIVTKIFVRIISFAIRLRSIETVLLKEATNMNDEMGENSWFRLIEYLQTLTGSNMSDKKSQIKTNIETLYTTWWKEQIIQKPKLDFYSKVKYEFKYEKYLNLPSDIRNPVVKLRTSCHKLPIEIGRYHNIDRNLRICKICNLKSVGDEIHYLKYCTNINITNAREDFLNKLKLERRDFENFSLNNIIDYGISLHDESIIWNFGLLIKNVLKAYAEETEEIQISSPKHVKTRYGRESRKPTKLNL